MLQPLRFGAIRTFTKTRFPQANRMATTKTDGLTIRFGPFTVTDQVFLKTEYSYALVNLKPLLPGHSLVCPLTPHLRLTDLSPPETADLFNTVQLIQRLLAKQYFPTPSKEGDDSEKTPAGSFTIGVQDGPEAGQTVPHVHVHVIPRTKGDMQSVDDIYAGMASEKGNVGGGLWDLQKRPEPAGAPPRIEDDDRPPRSVEDMNAEAERYRVTLREMGIDQGKPSL